MPTILEATEQRGHLLGDLKTLKATVDKRRTDNGEDWTSEERERFANLERAITEKSLEIRDLSDFAKISALETQQSQPQYNAAAPAGQRTYHSVPTRKEVNKLLSRWGTCRFSAEDEIRAIEYGCDFTDGAGNMGTSGLRWRDETRDLYVGDAAGANSGVTAAVHGYDTELLKFIKGFFSLLPYCRKRTTSTNVYETYRRTSILTGEQVDLDGTQTGTPTNASTNIQPNYDHVNVTMNEYDSGEFDISRRLLATTDVDLLSDLLEQQGEGLGRKLNTDCVKTMLGTLGSYGATTGRTLGAGTLTNDPTTSVFGWQDPVALEHAVDPVILPRQTSFHMAHSNTIGFMRQLRSSTYFPVNEQFTAQGFDAIQDGILVVRLPYLSRPVIVNNDMPDPTANSLSAGSPIWAFGDLNYLLYATNPSYDWTIRDEITYKLKGRIAFLRAQMAGFALLNNQAIKLIRLNGGSPLSMAPFTTSEWPSK